MNLETKFKMVNKVNKNADYEFTLTNFDVNIYYLLLKVRTFSC